MESLAPEPVRAAEPVAPPPAIARRGIPPAAVAIGIAAALAIGFFGGRWSAPRAPDETRALVAAAPTPESTATATAEPAASPVPSATEAVAAATAATPTPMPSATATATAVAVEKTPAPAPSATVVASLEKSPTPTPAPKPTKAAAPSITIADVLALQAAGKSDEMTAALEKLVKQDPSNGDAHWMLALEYRARKKGPKGCTEFRAYTKSAPSGEHAADAKRHLAVCRAVELLDKEKLDEAYAAFADIVKANYMFPDGHYWLGTMQSLKNENAAACTSFKSYLRLDGQGPYNDRATAQLSALGC